MNLLLFRFAMIIDEGLRSLLEELHFINNSLLFLVNLRFHGI